MRTSLNDVDMVTNVSSSAVSCPTRQVHSDAIHPALPGLNVPPSCDTSPSITVQVQ